jgi:excisionase family DNA binding protein
MIDMSELLTVEEVAQELRLHPDTVKRLLRRETIPGYKIQGEWRVKRSDLDTYIEAQKYRKER